QGWQRRIPGEERESGQDGGHPALFRLPASHRLPLRPPRFRTIQAHPKDRSIMVWQVEGRLPAHQRMGRAMDERTDQTQSWISDSLAMGLYPTLLFVVMLLWVYISA